MGYIIQPNKLMIFKSNCTMLKDKTTIILEQVERECINIHGDEC